MPYLKTDELPENIQKLDEKKQRQWMEVFNSSYKQAIESGKDKKEAETIAFKNANGVVSSKKESIAGGMNELRRKVDDAIRSKYGNEAFLMDIVDNKAVFEIMPNVPGVQRKEYQVKFKNEKNEIVFNGDPEEIEIAQTIRKKESVSLSFDSFQFLEAKEKGNVWDVVLLEEGFSKNNGSHGYKRYYPEKTLKSALKLFENAPAMAYKFAGKLKDLFDHSPESSKGNAGNQVGFFENIRYGSFKKKDGTKGKGILAKFHVLESADWLKKNLVQSWKHGKSILGFSIDADGSETPKIHDGQMVDWVESISNILENTVVTQPAAGGQIIRLVASLQDEPEKKGNKMDKEKIIALIKERAPHLLESKEVDKLTEDECLQLLKEALDENKEADEKAKKEKEAADLKAKEEADKKAADEKKEKEKVTESKIDPEILKKLERLEKLDEFEKKMELRESQTNFAAKLNESNLPDVIKNKLKKQYTDKKLTDQEIESLITSEQDTWAKLNESFPKSYEVEVGSEEKDKFTLAMDGFFMGENQKDKDGKIVQAFSSFKEAYAQIVGDYSAVYADPQIIISDSYFYSPELPNASFAESYNIKRRQALMESHFAEALKTSNWAEILGDSVTRAMIKEWSDEDYQSWRKIVSSIVPVRDFRTQRRMRMGGYGVLSSVSEQGTYQPVTSPNDEEVTYSAAKYGGLESLTMEMIANDDVGAIRMIPKKLGKAAAITLYRDIFNMFVNNQEQDDSTTLASTSRGNAASSNNALCSSGFATAVAQMKELAKYYGTSPDNVDLLGSAFKPRYIVTASELEDMAMRIYTSETSIAETGGSTGGVTVYTSTEPNLHKGKAEPLVIPYWTDADSWWLVADPKKAPTVEVGFFNGRQEPELFVQDNPTVGSVFTADKITYKVRYIYGFAVLDYRSFYYSA